MIDKAPRTRQDCIHGERPCPWITCRYHLLVDLLPRHTTDVDETDMNALYHAATTCLYSMKETCTLDLIKPGGMTLEEVGQIFGVTRERVRQIESRALRYHRIKRLIVRLVGREYLNELVGHEAIDKVLATPQIPRKKRGPRKTTPDDPTLPEIKFPQ